MKVLVFISIFAFVSSNCSFSQCDIPMSVEMSATAASCPTCCDVCITPVISGGCAPYSYAWFPQDPNLLPCSACPFETYTLTVTDACGCVVTDSLTTDTVSIGTSGIEEVEQIEFGIYPNPTDNFLTLSIGHFNPSYKITLMNIQGKIMFTTLIQSKTTTIPTDGLVAGVYLISIGDDRQIFQTKKWIKE